MRSFHFERPRGSVLATVALAAATIVAACNTDRILDVPTPDIINPASVNSAAGAEALRVGALSRLNSATSGGESFFLFGGMLSDEFRTNDTFQQRDETDQRAIQLNNATLDGVYRALQRARVAAVQAQVALKQYKPTAIADQGLMFWQEAYTENLAAENLCSGIPFSFPNPDGSSVEGVPLSTADVYTRALAHADSAIASSAGDIAKVTRGRIMINQGNFAGALAAVAGVPTSFVYLAEHSLTTRQNQIWSLNNSAKRYSVADVDGGTGLNFVSANDPRVPTSANGVGFDGRAGNIAQGVYGQTSSVPLVSGVEARLIEAEAQLKTLPAGDLTWLNTLNTLRTFKPVWLPATLTLAPLTDPGTAAGRVDLVFRERAFWLFGTGHRLGDLRRLIRQYSRGAETVFPTGIFVKGGTHGPDVNFPVVQSEENNSLFHGCIDRAA